MESLPNELVDSIIKKLYSDIPSLLSCALVGRAWVRSSQQGIFRDIVLSLPFPLPGDETEDFVMGRRDDYLNTTKKLVASFDSTPRLASYVRFLELQDILVEDELLHIATANLIQQLSSLNHLKLSDVHWTVLSSTLKAALAELFRTSSLTEFTFVGFFHTSLADVRSLLNRMPRQLKILHLISIYLDDFDPVDLPPKSIQLEKLTISNCYSTFFMDWFLKDTCPFEIRNLQSLVISKWEVRDVDRHLHYVGRSLRELTLDISSACNDCLTYTPNLRILHLRRIVLESSPSRVPMICTIFEPLFNPNGNKHFLQCLKIDLIFADISQLLAPLDRWAEIDELLNRLELSALERVDVNLSSRECSN